MTDSQQAPAPPSYEEINKERSNSNQYHIESSSALSNKPLSSSQKQIGGEKIKLYERRKDREKYENLAELYSIIYTVERLEKAYIKDSVDPDEYTKSCSKLISKFKTIRQMISDDVPDVERFMKEYKLDCPAAVNRLLRVGVPATVEHGSTKSDSGYHVAQTTQIFITLMDTLKLDLVDVDQLQPHLNDLMESVNNLTVKEFEYKDKLKEWLVTLNQMRAHDRLSEDQSRQFSFDLDQAYASFMKAL